MLPVFLSLALWSPPSAAFCGTYVSGDGTAVHNDASQVVVALSGDTTVLTLANDFTGDTASFGLIVPVPGSVTPDDVRVVTRDALDTLDAYTAPREVSYSCEDVVWVPDGDGGWEDAGVDGSSGGYAGCGGGGYASPYAGGGYDSALGGHEAGGGLGSSEYSDGLTVEHFTAGEYTLDLVDAPDGSALQAWLDENGFALPDGADVVLDDALLAGAELLVARISTEASSADARWLSPIQVRYAGTTEALPIRLGATASGGVQDMIVYGITTMTDGMLAIGNYPEFTVDTHCLLGDVLSRGYEDLFTATYEAAPRGGRAGWTPEFVSPQGVCDPLPPGGPIENGVLEDLGFPYGVENATLTRLHFRGSPSEIDQDLSLYTTGWADYAQQDYIRNGRYMHTYFRTCGEEEPEGRTGCPEPEASSPVDTGTTDTSPPSTDSSLCGGLSCASGLLPPLLGVTAVALRRRRRPTGRKSD